MGSGSVDKSGEKMIGIASMLLSMMRYLLVRIGWNANVSAK